MEDFLKLMHLDYIDCFVQMAELKLKSSNYSDEELSNRINEITIGSKVPEHISTIIAEFLQNGKLVTESRQQLIYFLLNHESFTALCTCDDKEVAVFV